MSVSGQLGMYHIAEIMLRVCTPNHHGEAFAISRWLQQYILAGKSPKRE